MYLVPLYAAQAELDQFVSENTGIDVNQDEIVDKTILGLKIEIAEFCNEWGGFKYWKQSHTIKRAETLEELADCIHLFLSVGNKRKYNFIQELKPFNYWKLDVGTMFDDLLSSSFSCSASWRTGFEKLICIGLKIGFTIAEMETMYYTKREKNFQRQINNY